MIATVVFDRQALKAVEQIWTAQEPALIVLDRNLRLWARESSKHEEHPKPRLHRRFGLRLDKVNNTSEPHDAPGSSMVGDIGLQLGDRHQPCMKEHVRGNDSFRQRIAPSQVDHTTNC